MQKSPKNPNFWGAGHLEASNWQKLEKTVVDRDRMANLPSSCRNIKTQSSIYLLGNINIFEIKSSLSERRQSMSHWGTKTCSKPLLKQDHSKSHVTWEAYFKVYTLFFLSATVTLKRAWLMLTFKPILAQFLSYPHPCLCALNVLLQT